MKFPFRKMVVGSVAAWGIASVVIHPFGDIKGVHSTEPLLSGAGADTAVVRTFERACRSCHSEKTQWPWYSYVAPLSWMVENDVHNGRGHMNLSRWNEYTAEEKRELLGAIASAMRNRVMPPPRYLYLHPEAKLSSADIELVHRWITTERRRLRDSGD